MIIVRRDFLGVKVDINNANIKVQKFAVRISITGYSVRRRVKFLELEGSGCRLFVNVSTSIVFYRTIRIASP